MAEWLSRGCGAAQISPMRTERASTELTEALNDCASMFAGGRESVRECSFACKASKLSFHRMPRNRLKLGASVPQGGLAQSLHPASLHDLTHPLFDLARLLVAELHDVRRNHRLSISTVAGNAQVTAVPALPASSPSLVQRATDSAALLPPSSPLCSLRLIKRS